MYSQTILKVKPTTLFLVARRVTFVSGTNEGRGKGESWKVKCSAGLVS